MNLNMEKIYDYAPIMFMFVGMAINFITAIPPQIRSAATLLSLIASVGWIAVLEIVFRLKASEYLYIKMICRPSQRVLHLWIMEPKEGIRGRRIPGTYDMYFTPVDLAEPVKYGMFEQVTSIDLTHQWAWEERMIFVPGRAMYKGYPLQHSKTATVVVWEAEQDDTRLDFNEAIPRFSVVEAPRDWYLMDEPPPVQRPGTIETVPQSIQELVAQLNASEREALNWKTRYENEHRLRIRVHGFVQSLQNQFEGAISRTRDVTKLVKEELVTLLAAHTTLEGAASELEQRNWLTITRNVALLIVGLVTVVLFATRSDLRNWITENWWFIIILAVIGATAIYYMRKK